MFDRISYYFFNENYEKCLNLSEEFLSTQPRFALQYCAICSFKIHDFNKALYYTKELFKLNPTSFNGLLLAKTLLKFEPKEATSLLEQLFQRRDDLADEIAFELALVYKQQNTNLEKSENILKALLQNNRYNLDLWKIYAELYFKIDFNKALNAHEEVKMIAEEIIQKIKNGELATVQNTSKNLEQRLQEKTQENTTLIKIQNFLNMQILPQEAYLLFKLFKLDESLKLFESLCEFNQNNAQFWQNYAKVLELSLKYDEAYKAYEKAYSLHPHATYQFDMAYLLMRLGENEKFEKGKKLYESRLFYAHNETFSNYHYNKTLQAFNAKGLEAFKDKEILVFCEQGFGDTIMYSRCLEKLCTLASKVLFAPQSAMYTMFKNQIQTLSKTHDVFSKIKVLKDFPNQFDYAMPICSLPFFIDLKLKDLEKAKTPIVPLNPPKNARKKVGIFWYTPSANDSDFLRNFEFQFLWNALKSLDCDVVSFQIAGEEVKNLPKEIENRGKEIKNFNDTVKNLADIDVMISIDSAIAHLSLALQIPTIVLLKPRFDWRWGKFEKPKSFFWPNAKFIVCKDEKNAKKELQKMLQAL